MTNFFISVFNGRTSFVIYSDKGVESFSEKLSATIHEGSDTNNKKAFRLRYAYTGGEVGTYYVYKGQPID